MWQYTALAYSFPNLEPAHCSLSSPSCCFLTRIQIFKKAGKVVWYSHLFKNFPQFVVIYKVRGFGIVNKAKLDVCLFVFLEIFCFFDGSTDVGNLISDSSAFSKSSLNIWKFLVHVLLKPRLENFEHYFASMWDKCKCAIVWTLFGTAFLWDWMKTNLFQSSGYCWISKFADLLSVALSQHHLLGFEIAQQEFHNIL